MILRVGVVLALAAAVACEPVGGDATCNASGAAVLGCADGECSCSVQFGGCTDARAYEVVCANPEGVPEAVCECHVDGEGRRDFELAHDCAFNPSGVPLATINEGCGWTLREP